MAARDRQRLQMITTLMLSSIEIVDRVVQQGIVAIDAVIVRIVETRDAHGLLTRVLRLLRTDQMNLATHLDAVVESVDRVSTVVSLAVSRDFSLVHVVTLYVATCKQVVMSVLAADTRSIFAFQRCQVLVLATG